MSGSQTNPVRRAAIAGAGTSGLIAALLLHRLGWEVTVVEAHARARTGTRAPTLWPPALHVLGLVGVAGKVMAEGHPVSVLRFRTETGERRLDLGAAGCVTLSQSRLERLLEDRARRVGVRIHRGVRVTGAHQQDDGRVLVTGKGDVGTFPDLTVDLLIGADGYRSIVREAIGVELAGPGRGTRFALRDFVDDTGGFDRDAVWTCTGEPGALVTVPLPENTIRLVAPFPGEDTHAGADFLRERALEHGFPTPEGPVVWEATFLAHTQQATRFAQGPIALIGDAAHVQSPAGGRGMNQGIEDAFTLVSEIGADTSDDLVAAVARYAAIREPELSDELAANAAVTSHWNGTEPAALIAPVIRSELEVASCSFRRVSAIGSVTPDETSPLGRRVRLTTEAWPRLSSLRLHHGLIVETTPASPAIGRMPSLVGNNLMLPDGKYTLSPTMNILSFEPVGVPA